jgi:hypothetical protein
MEEIGPADCHDARTPVEHAFHSVEPTGPQPNVGIYESNKIPGCFLKPALARIPRPLALLRYDAYLWVAARDFGGSVGARVIDDDDFTRPALRVSQYGLEAGPDLSFFIERGNDEAGAHPAHFRLRRKPLFVGAK